jgi:hypothetical protein
VSEPIAAALVRLTATGARTELRMTRRPGRRFGPIRRPDVLEPAGRVWRLGVLLLDAEGRLYRTGEVIQAQTLRFDNHQSNRAAARRELREALDRAGVEAGETVNVDAEPVAVDDVREVSWNGSGDPTTFVPLADYLRDRVELLADPPGGA